LVYRAENLLTLKGRSQWNARRLGGLLDSSPEGACRDGAESFICAVHAGELRFNSAKCSSNYRNAEIDSSYDSDERSLPFLSSKQSTSSQLI
jgi:hypothetical protein